MYYNIIIDTNWADRLFSTWQEYVATSPVPSSSSRSRSRLNPPNTQYIRNRLLRQLARTHLDNYITYHFGVHQFWRYSVYCHLSWYYTCFKNKNTQPLIPSTGTMRDSPHWLDTSHRIWTCANGNWWLFLLFPKPPTRSVPAQIEIGINDWKCCRFQTWGNAIPFSLNRSPALSLMILFQR